MLMKAKLEMKEHYQSAGNHTMESAFWWVSSVDWILYDPHSIGILLCLCFSDLVTDNDELSPEWYMDRVTTDMCKHTTLNGDRYVTVGYILKVLDHTVYFSHSKVTVLQKQKNGHMDWLGPVGH